MEFFHPLLPWAEEKHVYVLGIGVQCLLKETSQRLKENEGIDEEKGKKGGQTGFHAQPQNQEVGNKTVLYLVVGQFSPERKF